MIGLALALAAAATGDPGPIERCDPPPGWEAVAARGTRYVIFGEEHGSAEAPAFVGDVACALLFRGERVLVALEQDAIEDRALQAIWALPNDRFAAALDRLSWWSIDDGRGSRAMHAMLLRLHRLSDGGRSIDIVGLQPDAAQASNYAALPGQRPHEAAQTANIRCADAGRYDRVLILVGAGHARKAPLTRGGATYQPMAMRLAAAAAITSLVMRTAGGVTWSCEPRPGAIIVRDRPSADEIDCAAHRTGASGTIAGPPSIGLGTAPGADSDPAYDGWFWLGRVTASPPQVAARP